MARPTARLPKVNAKNAGKYQGLNAAYLHYSHSSCLRPDNMLKLVRRLRPLDRCLGRFINVFLRQTQQAVQRALGALKVTAAIGIENAGHQLRVTRELAFLYLLHATGEPLTDWLSGDGPIVRFGTSHTLSGLQYVLLAYGEGLDVHYLVSEVLEAGFDVEAFGLDGKT